MGFNCPITGCQGCGFGSSDPDPIFICFFYCRIRIQVNSIQIRHPALIFPDDISIILTLITKEKRYGWMGGFRLKKSLLFFRFVKTTILVGNGSQKVLTISIMDKTSWTYSIPFTALLAAMGSREYSSMTCIIL